MAGVINRPVAAAGLIAFQEKENPLQFIYFPSSVQAVIGETIEDFKCQYYGIGEKPQWIQTGSSKFINAAGGTVSGKCKFDATNAQKEALKEEIAKVFEIEDPQLVPAILKDTKAVPVFAKGVADLGGNSKYTFPEGISVGGSFNFNIDSGNSLFAQIIARQDTGQDTTTPEIGMNISGKLELYGEPFEARIEADLSQVWAYTRDQVNVEANFGWFELGSQFDNIAQDLVKNNIIKITFKQGRADSEFGLQLLESTKKVFEAINAQITSGEGMFRFMPNPDPQVPKDPEKSWMSSLAPFTVGLNMSFVRNSFSQSIKFDQTVSFTGIYTINVHSSMNMGVICNTATQGLFFDLTNNENSCITTKKVDALQKRILKEVIAKETQIQKYMDKLENGIITLATYEALVAQLNTRMLSELHPDSNETAESIIAGIEAYVLRRTKQVPQV